MRVRSLFLSFALLLTGVFPAFASSGGGTEIQNLTGSFMGILSLIIFVAAYSLVIFEEQLHLRKSKPVMLAAGLIWVLVALAYAAMGDTHTPHEAIKHNLVIIIYGI